MADTKISALGAATTPLTGTEELPIVQGGGTQRVRVSNLTTGRAVSAASLALTGSPLPTASGGTGYASYAVGDMLYADTTTTLSKLVGVATGNALLSGGVGVAPLWGKVGLGTHIDGTLQVGNGGTGTTTAFTTGSVVFAGSSGIYSQNNANLHWDTATNYLFVGKASSGNTTGVEVRAHGAVWAIGDNQAPVNTVQSCFTNSNSSNTDLMECNVGHYQRTALYVRNSGAGAGNTCNHIHFQYGAGTLAGYITSVGTTTSYSSASDARLKKDLGVCLVSRIQNVVIHNFEWKGTGVRTIGAFAQELLDAVPEAVTVGTDEVNQNGELMRPWGVDYAKLVPDLIIEIQQLRARVAALEGK